MRTVTIPLEEYLPLKALEITLGDKIANISNNEAVYVISRDEFDNAIQKKLDDYEQRLSNMSRECYKLNNEIAQLSIKEKKSWSLW